MSTTTQRKIMIAANWKMHLNVSQSSLLIHRLHERIKTHRSVEVVLAPSMLVLQPVSMQIDRRKFHLAAQNAYQVDEGAYTGEVSFSMLQDMVHYVFIGHSDRRNKFNENLDTICAKMAAAVRNGITPLLCVGETKTERLAGETTRVLHDQVTTALANLTAREVQEVVIAYEPVWALSSGTDFMHHETPKPDEIAKAVETIRHNIKELYGVKASKQVRVLYGGSANASSAYDLLGVEGVDGLLVGGASLNYHEFSAIVDAAFRVQQEE
ncbi:triose-phosphate isomerase [bacterium]|nr:triose-phosphate isomerase [bacterium]NBX97727.1 triose-phosphate isomerase [bacterium]NDC94755.1 triose-phosphate isomerase [bacterium]NDD84429.1 triose-phosphate isomerase [bacterium]NDG30246.1 triose-phosphate isomerase [bacterium]